MRPGSIAISVLSLGIAFLGVIWFGRSDVKVEPVVPESHKPQVVDTSNLPKPAEQGPHPTVFVDNKEHDFGLMQLGEKGEHEYEFTNKGESPLQIAVGKSSCQCTIGDMEGTKVIAVGETTKVKLKWEIRKSDAHFQHSAEIHTNDPQDAIVALVIKGSVGRDFIRSPESSWIMSTFTQIEKAVFIGKVLSDTQDFEVTKVEIDSPLFKADFARGTEADLQAVMNDRSVQIMTPDERPIVPKATWRITISALDELPVGAFKANVTVHTTLEAMKTNTFEVIGKREGPVRVVATVKSGMRYHAASQLVEVGEFKASEGQEVRFMMLVSKPLTEDLKIETISDPEWLEVELKPGVINANGSRHELVIRIPAGKSPIVKTTDHPATVRLKTNVPDGGETLIRIAYVAQ